MTCASCGSITCPHPDPVYAGIAPAALNDRLSDRETDGLGGQVQGTGVHIHSATAKEARHHG